VFLPELQPLISIFLSCKPNAKKLILDKHLNEYLFVLDAIAVPNQLLLFPIYSQTLLPFENLKFFVLNFFSNFISSSLFELLSSSLFELSFSELSSSFSELSFSEFESEFELSSEPS
jgi:hypothetical protein